MMVDCSSTPTSNLTCCTTEMKHAPPDAQLMLGVFQEGTVETLFAFDYIKSNVHTITPIAVSDLSTAS